MLTTALMLYMMSTVSLSTCPSAREAMGRVRRWISKRRYLDSKGTLVANITKWWAGGKSGFEGCCIEGQNASTYVIDILGANSPGKPVPGYSESFGGRSRLDTKQKSALIGAAMLIDYSFYQMKDDSG